MEKGLWTLLIENLRQLKPKARLNIIILMIIIYTLWYALLKTKYEIRNEIRGGRDAMIHELRDVIVEDNSKIIKLQNEKDSLLTLNGKLGIKIVIDSVKQNSKLIEQNKQFITKQNEIKNSLK